MNRGKKVWGSYMACSSQRAPETAAVVLRRPTLDLPRTFIILALKVPQPRKPLSPGKWLVTLYGVLGPHAVP